MESKKQQISNFRDFRLGAKRMILRKKIYDFEKKETYYMLAVTLQEYWPLRLILRSCGPSTMDKHLEKKIFIQNLDLELNDD